MFFKYTWPAIAWAMVVLVLTAIPGKYIPPVSSFWESLKPDMLVHIFLFGVFIILLLRGFRKQDAFRWLHSTYVFSAWLTGAFFGALTELLQKFVFIGRTGSLYDFLADLAGCLVGMGVYFWGMRK
jgi:hypothetical protein